MKPKKEKTLITLLCSLGILAVGYGMYKKNDLIFLVGLLLVIAGYLLIRRKLKESVQNRS